jgi:hypothetical protein
MPQRRPTPSSHRGFSHPLLFAQHLCYRDGKFAADNRQCVYICFLDLCILRELLVCRSGWPVQGCRIESRYAATWTPNPPYSPPPALSEGGHGCLTSLSIAVRRAFDPASISSPLSSELRLDRINAPWLLEGPDGESFRTYVERVLVPTLRRGDIVIMDNLGSQEARPCASSSAQPGPSSSFSRNIRPISIPLNRPSPSSNTSCAKQTPDQ